MPANALPTTNVKKYQVRELIEYSFRECGQLAEQQTPQYVEAAKQSLHYLLQDLSNKNILLWQLRYILQGGRAGQRQLLLPPGVIDVREANYRYPINPIPTNVLPSTNPSAANAFDLNILANPAVATSTDNWFGANYTSGLRVLHVGINAYSPTSNVTTYTPYLEYSADGVTWTLYQTLTATSLNDTEWMYWQIDGAPTANYWRVRQDISAGLLQIRQLVFGNVQQDIPLYRLNRDDYFNLPNKDFPSDRALQYWYDRQADRPIMNLWPVPQDDFQIFQLLVEDEMPDIGSLGSSLVIPNRWINAIQSMLSYRLSLQIAQTPADRITLLSEKAQLDYQSALNEERDQSDSTLIPGIGVYTR